MWSTWSVKGHISSPQTQPSRHSEQLGSTSHTSGNYMDWKQVISDRGPQFISEFTCELYRLLGIKLAATTAYHPQADDQTERVNQELEQYLRLFINERQDNWDNLLSMA